MANKSLWSKSCILLAQPLQMLKHRFLSSMKSEQLFFRKIGFGPCSWGLEAAMYFFKSTFCNKERASFLLHRWVVPFLPLLSCIFFYWKIEGFWFSSIEKVCPNLQVAFIFQTFLPLCTTYLVIEFFLITQKLNEGISIFDVEFHLQMAFILRRISTEQKNKPNLTFIMTRFLRIIISSYRGIEGLENFISALAL